MSPSKLLKIFKKLLKLFKYSSMINKFALNQKTKVSYLNIAFAVFLKFAKLFEPSNILKTFEYVILERD